MNLNDIWDSEEQKRLFEFYFRGSAEIYRRIYIERKIKKCRADVVAKKLGYSESSVRRIVKAVDDLLKDADAKAGARNYGTGEPTGSIYMPTEFARGIFTKLSRDESCIFRETIYLYQHDLGNVMHRDRLLAYASQYRDPARRSKLLGALRNLEVKTPDGEVVKIYESVTDDRGTIHFQFTDSARLRIEAAMVSAAIDKLFAGIGELI